MSKGLILIADDDEEILKAMTLRLEAQGYEVVTAVDAMQAVMKARQRQPDVAILDIYMPAGNGISITEKFTASDAQEIPVILVTADAQLQTRDRAEASGAKYFLTKPFETKELLKCVEEALQSKKAA